MNHERNDALTPMAKLLLGHIRRIVREELEAARANDDRRVTPNQLAREFRRAPQYIRDLCEAGILPGERSLGRGGREGWLIKYADAAKIIPLAPRVGSVSNRRRE